MSRKTKKFTYTDGSYFCNICDEAHEGEELAIDCYEACLDDAKLKATTQTCRDLNCHNGTVWAHDLYEGPCRPEDRPGIANDAYSMRRVPCPVCNPKGSGA